MFACLLVFPQHIVIYPESNCWVPLCARGTAENQAKCQLPAEPTLQGGRKATSGWLWNMSVADEFHEEKQNRVGGLKSDRKGSMCSTSDRVVKEDLSIKTKQNNKTRKRWREKSN